LRGHLINEIGIKDEELEADKIADPRFQLTAAVLKEQGIDDFQLHYAMETLRRTTKSTVALRPAKR
ncbi:MAG: peptidase S41, partial [Erythrobacter sp.]|nr:peptidase S41 [Erythrobacter sp.]